MKVGPVKSSLSVLIFLALLSTPALATVTVTSPISGSTVNSPVQYVATASASTCAQGVAAMGIYVNNQLIYTVNGASLNTSVTMANGSEHTVVEEWDFCGGATYTTVNVNVGAAPTTTAVNVTSPVAGSTDASPVHYVANATTATCAGGVAAMGIYDNNSLVYSANGTSLNTNLALANGSHHTVVEEWDYCGGAAYTTVNINVGAAPTQTAVTVSSPTAGSTVTSPVSFVATATTASCAGGVAAMGIYVNGTLTYTVNSASMNTSLTMAAGPQHAVVEEWDYCGGAAYTVIDLTVQTVQPPAVAMTADSSTITAGSSSTLVVTGTNTTGVTVTGSDGSSYTLPAAGGKVSVTPTATTTYTAEGASSAGTVSTTATVTVIPATSLNAVSHVIFMLQENHSFDNYFGMLNPYRKANGWNIGDDGKEYDIDGIDDKLSTSNEDDEGTAYTLYKFRTTCVDDMSSSWLESYGDVSRWNALSTRSIFMDGFVHDAEGYAKSCASSGRCDGAFTDTTGERSMGYYDQGFLNYYYYMASQFAVSDRWFSPVASKSVPNRIATFTGGTTQGLVFDPGGDDHLPQLNINNIFQELDASGVSWKIYYTVTQGYCTAGDPCGTGNANYPDSTFEILSYSFKFLYQNPGGAACTGTTQPSSAVGDTTNSFCIDPTHVAPISTYFTDIKNGALPSFAFIESGSGLNDEHPGSQQSILNGQSQVASVVNGLMASPAWSSSVFFFTYDEGGGPYDHVPPVPGHSNQFTDTALGAIPDISAIAVNADAYNPCLPSGGVVTLHCDLLPSDPGTNSGDAAAQYGFAAQLGFRLPNIVISPFTRKHYVSHIPMDHTAVIKFVENRFIGSPAHLTNRDAAQPDLLDFFDFTAKPWLTPPTPPAPVTPTSLGYEPCSPTLMGP
jgi:phospholipase C